MSENSAVEPVVEDASTFTEFINLTGDISKTLYLTTHPEENNEAPHLIVSMKAGSNEGSANAGTVDALPTAA